MESMRCPCAFAGHGSDTEFTMEKDSPERFGAGNGDKNSADKGRS